MIGKSHVIDALLFFQEKKGMQYSITLLCFGDII